MELDKVYHGDCLEVLRTFPEESIDFSVFSPPYDAVRDYNGFSFDYKQLGKEIFRVMKPGGVCACVIGDGTQDFAKSMTTMRLAVDWVDNAGWRMFETCIYHRHGRPGGWWNQRFRVDHEFILIFFKGDRPKCFDKKHMMVKTKTPNAVWHGTDRHTDGSLSKVVDAPINEFKCRGSIWFYPASNTEGNRLKLTHPATFPDSLAFDLIKCFTAEGDIVLDPTSGSGTSLVVAARCGRKYVGIDISEDYVALAKQRLASEVKQDIL